MSTSSHKFLVLAFELGMFDDVDMAPTASFGIRGELMGLFI